MSSISATSGSPLRLYWNFLARPRARYSCPRREAPSCSTLQRVSLATRTKETRPPSRSLACSMNCPPNTTPTDGGGHARSVAQKLRLAREGRKGPKSGLYVSFHSGTEFHAKATHFETNEKETDTSTRSAEPIAHFILKRFHVPCCTEVRDQTHFRTLGSRQSTAVLNAGPSSRGQAASVAHIGASIGRERRIVGWRVRKARERSTWMGILWLDAG